MVRLSRTVRFVVNPSPSEPGEIAATNGFGGKPAMRGFGRYYELDAVCSGEPDPHTGYLINIKTIDEAVRSGPVRIVERVCREDPGRDPAPLLPDLFRDLAARLPVALDRLTLRLTPTYSLAVERDAMSTAILRQQFDFAAAHRLHVPALSDEENRRTFGRCNNPAGHGHNYRVETAVAVSLDPGRPPFSLADLEPLVDEVLVERFDHKHLNEDTAEFATGSGLNPSVEHIAKVFFERLAPAVDRASDGRAALRSITVWETDRTSATYPG